ncbi:beta-1,4-glucuronyltransferase 1 [Drosophila persimilis]|uniref:beta-1,4-glucuronyltransferase 1 n=1 Tax=Drosophila persimilis TaxID=7234 RepID=UPI000F094AFE|nr:beta-1,4-glucuronyltransferase 1 [Drosophila persimilis]
MKKGPSVCLFFVGLFNFNLEKGNTKDSLGFLVFLFVDQISVSNARLVEQETTWVDLGKLRNCKDREHKSVNRLRGKFWVLQNFVRADHGRMSCSSNVTYTTHADYRYLDNLVPLLERWRSPLSLALYAPGTDWEPTIESILWLLQCDAGRDLVRGLTSFHIYFQVGHTPRVVLRAETILARKLDCGGRPPYEGTVGRRTYRSQKDLDYPVNTGRNIAREAALTHFVLASDIELYPTPGLVPKFFTMLGRHSDGFTAKHLPVPVPVPVVYVLRIFEVESNATMPSDKLQLQDMLWSSQAVPFHMNICPHCHKGPKLEEWINASVSDELNVSHKGIRMGRENRWEPIFIGSTTDPPYDERLSWEAMSDKMTQAYAMCALGYEFHILDNAFLVHKPGIKPGLDNPERHDLALRTESVIRSRFFREMRIIYGSRDGCLP